MNNCLYVFVDESGNLDFTSKGTRHYVLAAVTAWSPLDSSSALQKLKYKLIALGNGGDEYQCFHASEDRQGVRDQVFDLINNLQNINVNYIYAEKNKTHPSYQNSKFYSLLGSALAKYLLIVNKQSPYEKVIIIFDKALPNKDRNNFLKEVKPKLKNVGKPYAIYFHQTMSDFNGQIADYFAWSKYISLERNEKRPLESISNIPSQSFDIFSKGENRYY